MIWLLYCYAGSIRCLCVQRSKSRRRNIPLIRSQQPNSFQFSYLPFEFETAPPEYRNMVSIVSHDVVLGIAERIMIHQFERKPLLLQTLILTLGVGSAQSVLCLVPIFATQCGDLEFWDVEFGLSSLSLSA